MSALLILIAGAAGVAFSIPSRAPRWERAMYASLYCACVAGAIILLFQDDPQ